MCVLRPILAISVLTSSCQQSAPIAIEALVGLENRGALTSEPRLSIDAGFHSAPITALAADRDGRTVVTCSEDKTLRIWHVDSGEFVAGDVLRPPIGAGSEGSLSTCTISPDGSSVAMADARCIYLVDRRTQAMRRIDGLAQVAQLEFDPTGQLLLARSSGSAGVRCFDLTGDEKWRAQAFRSPGLATTHAGWLPNGDCLVVAEDEEMHLYAEDGSLFSTLPARSSTLR